MTSDSLLLGRIAKGDRNAFHALYERHADRIFRYVLGLIRKPHLAEEVLQETMLAVWNGAAKFRGASQVGTWVLGIARNQAYGLLRREERGRRLPEEPDKTADPAPDIERSVAVTDALETLPPAQREVLHLVYYENLSVRETAEILGIPAGTVKSRMFHARQTLEKELA